MGVPVLRVVGPKDLQGLRKKTGSVLSLLFPLLASKPFTTCLLPLFLTPRLGSFGGGVERTLPSPLIPLRVLAIHLLATLQDRVQTLLPP